MSDKDDISLKYSITQVGIQLAQWILDSKLVEHIFGPNLHVEVN